MPVGLRPPSSSDLLALRRAGRGKLLAIVAVGAAALVAAAASFLIEPEGTGNPDDPTRILVVTQGQPPGYGMRLREWGFEAAEGAFVTWDQKARDELEQPPATEVARLLALADEFGYGYVVFEHPQRVDFSGAEIADVPVEFPPGTRFAAVSAGDLADPATLTHHGRPPRSIRDPSLLLLDTLFQQPALHALKDAGGPGGLANLELRDRLHAGLDQLSRLPRAEALVAKVRDEVRAIVEEDSPEAALVEPVGLLLEHNVALPLADGSTLVAGRGYSLVSHDAVRVSVDFDEQEYLRVVGDGGTLANGRLCPEPAGPLVPPGEAPRITVAVDGRSVAARTPAGRWQIWLLQSDGECRLQGLGTVDPPSLDVLGEPMLGVEHVAWSGEVDGAAVVAAVSLGDRTQTLLGMLEGHSFGAPVWIDDGSLFVVDRSPEGVDGVAFFSLERSLIVPRLDASAFHGSERLGSVAWGRDAKGEFLVAVAGPNLDRLYRADLPEGWRAAFERTPDLPAAGRPISTPLDSNQIRITALTHRGHPHSLHVDTSGRWLAFGWTLPAPGDGAKRHEVALLDLAKPASVTVLTDNQSYDGTPRFLRKQRRLLFSTGYFVPRTNVRVLAGRWVSLPR